MKSHDWGLSQERGKQARPSLETGFETPMAKS